MCSWRQREIQRVEGQVTEHVWYRLSESVAARLGDWSLPLQAFREYSISMATLTRLQRVATARVAKNRPRSTSDRPLEAGLTSGIHTVHAIMLT